jgi:hypothetical protein
MKSYTLLSTLISLLYLFTFALAAPHTKNSTTLNPTNTPTALQPRAFGTCVDYCSGRDGTDCSMVNQCTDAGHCVNLPKFMYLQSIKFTGDTWCELWTNQNCNGENFAYEDPHTNLSDLDWGGRTRSLACWRYT